MSDTEIIEPTAQEEPIVEPKPKRTYKKRVKTAVEQPKPETPPVPVIALPNPAVEQLQRDILALVNQRTEALHMVRKAGAAVNHANAQLQESREYLTQLEQEVQYRMSLISQMKGETAPTYMSGRDVMEYMNIPTPQDIPMGFGVHVPDGVSSIPAPRTTMAPPQGPRVRSESAAGMRDEFATRAAI